MRDPVLDKLDLTFEDIGEQMVKNIARPIHAFRVRFEGFDIAVSAPGTAVPRRKRLAAIVVSGLALLVIAGAAMRLVTRSEVAPGAQRLSIVVLPFVNLSGDPTQEYFADGITENLTTDLSRIPGSFVIARGSAFTYKGKTVDARQVGRELGVRYIIEGSVQRFGTAIWVSARLIDTESSAQLWAERFDGELSRLSDLENAVTTRVSRSLSIELPQAEQRRFRREHPDNPDAVDYVLQAQAIYDRGLLPKAAQNEMRRLAEAALRLDPKNFDALMWLATADIDRVMNYYSENRTDQLRQAEEEIDRALGAAPSSFYAHYTKGKVFMTQKKHVEATTEFEAALRLNSNYVPAYGRIGEVKSYVGHPELDFPHFRLRGIEFGETRFSKLVGISMISPIGRDVEKFGGHQSTRRTAAMASLNVGSCLRYQAAALGRSAVVVSRARPSAHTVISENSPSSAGVVRRMARSDH